MTSVILGVDPGLGGAVFFLDPADPAGGTAVDIPVHVLGDGARKKRRIDAQTLVRLLAADIGHAFVEYASARPGQGVSGVFVYGACFGMLQGILAARQIPMTLVSPVQWKRVLAVPKAKDGARARASQLLPRAAHQWPLVKNDGRAEAALIALYGFRQLGQTAPCLGASIDPVCQHLIGLSIDEPAA